MELAVDSASVFTGKLKVSLARSGLQIHNICYCLKKSIKTSSYAPMTATTIQIYGTVGRGDRQNLLSLGLKFQF